VLFVVLYAALTGVRAGASELSCQDAARAAAREAARGESTTTVVATARRLAPANAVIAVHRTGSLVRVTVRAQVSALGGMPLPALQVGGSAVAEVEH
jgi:hypothetical protein